MTGTGVQVGLDVGGTKIAGIAIDEDGSALAHVRLATSWGADAVVRDVLDAVAQLQERLAAAGSPRAVTSIGVGIPGLVDARAGRVLHAVNIGVESLQLADRVTEVTGVPCFVENDVKAAALGAAALGSITRPMAYLNLGTGVAAGIIVDGRIWRGARGTAGEVGHLVVDPRGRQCGCGQHGCIESFAGGGALGRAWGRGGALPVRDMLDAADAGDERAGALRDGLFLGAASAVRALVLTADVDTVVIGGGLTAMADRIEPGIRERLRREAEASPFLRSLRLDERIEMLPATSPVAAVGAALLGSATEEPSTRKKESAVHG